MEHRQLVDGAKQFIPFDALKGLQEALREKEQDRIPRPELSEEKKEEIDRCLHLLRDGDPVAASFYRRGRRLTGCGTVSHISVRRRSLLIDGTEVPFEDLLELERL